jgi:hypothetical protein
MKIRFDSLAAGRFAAKLIVALATVLTMRGVQAHDAFDAVKCDGDVAAALSGKHLGEESDDVLEKKHASIGLKAEGGEIISDDLNYAAWTICGGSFHVLERGNVIRGVVRADHSRSAPAFLGQCELNGKPMSGLVFAILKPSSTDDAHASARDHTLMPAARAWRIDEKSGRFVETSADGMMCPRDGVATADGGP